MMARGGNPESYYVAQREDAQFASYSRSSVLGRLLHRADTEG